MHRICVKIKEIRIIVWFTKEKGGTIVEKLLDVFDLYADSDGRKINNFKNKLLSTMDVTIETNKPKIETMWINMMEDTLVYIENILKEPKRLIVNEEEVVKIEKIKKVTVESIKHLSKNAGFIEDVKENGDIQPGKLLNVFKEETINTYENRFIYTLIQKMLIVIRKEKEKLLKSKDTKSKEYKKVDYSGRSYTGKNRVDMQLIMSSTTESSGRAEDVTMQLNRIKMLERNVISLTYSNTYQTLDKMRVPLVTPPLRKNNVLLKNVNFQYAVRLWDFLIDEFDKKETKTENEVKKRNYKDRGKAKKYVDDTFLLDYLILECVENPEIRERRKKEIIEKLIANVVEKTIDVDSSISEGQLKDLVGKQFTIIKYRNQLTNKEIQEIFKKHINMYMQKVTR